MAGMAEPLHYGGVLAVFMAGMAGCGFISILFSYFTIHLLHLSN